MSTLIVLGILGAFAIFTLWLMLRDDGSKKWIRTMWRRLLVANAGRELRRREAARITTYVRGLKLGGAGAESGPIAEVKPRGVAGDSPTTNAEAAVGYAATGDVQQRRGRAAPDVPTTETADLEPTDVSALLRHSYNDVRFVDSSHRFVPCTCCARPSTGGIAAVLHVKGDAEEDVALKVFAPAPTRRLVKSSDELQETFRRLEGMPDEMFVSTKFFPKGLVFQKRGEPGVENHRLDIAVMRYLQSDLDREMSLSIFAKRYRSDPELLVKAAAALRELWNRCAQRGVAHGDPSAENIILILDSLGDRAVRAVLIDLDTVSWEDHCAIATRCLGAPGYSMPQRRKSPARFVEKCRDHRAIHMMDVPANLIIYISLIAYAVGIPDLPGPDQTLAFTPDDLEDKRLFEARVEQLKRGFGQGDLARIAGDLLEDLRAHYVDPDGIDPSRRNPFFNEERAKKMTLMELELLQARKGA